MKKKQQAIYKSYKYITMVTKFFIIYQHKYYIKQIMRVTQN